MKSHIAGVLFGILILTCGQAYAQSAPQYARPGFYIGGGGAYAIEDFDNTFGLDFDNGPGFNGRLGYRFHPHIAIEAMIERVDAFDLKGFNGVEINTWTGTLNGKFYALTDRFQPYGLLGMGAMRAEANLPGSSNDFDDTDFAFRVGVGLDSYMTEHWLVNVEISNVHPSGDVDDINYYSLGGGIQYRF
ncbi:MAG: porin family protein [Nitrospirota bacterium]|nr:porin family protein [Nitrospirota bacterium]MDH5700698.1 porin family protein [Nitrospirota bacterium]